jgi:hypothetical protein
MEIRDFPEYFRVYCDFFHLKEKQVSAHTFSETANRSHGRQAQLAVRHPA